MARAGATQHTDEAESRRLRIFGTIARDLGIGIVTGVYPPGHLFESEKTASVSLHVSRTAYREALRTLAAKGLVESRPKSGTKVSDPSNWNLLDPDILSWIFVHDPREEHVEMLFEMRLVVEPRIAALAASRRTAEQLERMRASMVLLEEHGLRTEAGQLADQQFHAALVDASGNMFLRSLSSGIVAAVAWTTIFKARHQRLNRDAVPDHKDVFDAIAAKDPFAAHAAMKQLIDFALRDTLPGDHHSAELVS